MTQPHLQGNNIAVIPNLLALDNPRIRLAEHHYRRVATDRAIPEGTAPFGRLRLDQKAEWATIMEAWYEFYPILILIRDSPDKCFVGFPSLRRKSAYEESLDDRSRLHQSPPADNAAAKAFAKSGASSIS